MVILSIKTLNFKLYDDYNMEWGIFNSSGALFTPPHSIQPRQKTKYYLSRTHHYFSCTNPHHNYKRVFDALNSNIHVQVSRVQVLSIFVVEILRFNQCIGFFFPRRADLRLLLLFLFAIFIFCVKHCVCDSFCSIIISLLLVFSLFISLFFSLFNLLSESELQSESESESESPIKTIPNTHNEQIHSM
eukprot:235572_1